MHCQSVSQRVQHKFLQMVQCLKRCLDLCFMQTFNDHVDQCHGAQITQRASSFKRSAVVCCKAACRLAVWPQSRSVSAFCSFEGLQPESCLVPCLSHYLLCRKCLFKCQLMCLVVPWRWHRLCMVLVSWLSALLAFPPWLCPGRKPPHLLVCRQFSTYSSTPPIVSTGVQSSPVLP